MIFLPRCVVPNVLDPVAEIVTLGAEVTDYPVAGGQRRERAEWLDPGTMPEPEPLRYAVENLVPEGWITTLYGRGGSAKSYLALIAAYSIVLGEPVLGCAVQQGTVLYVDGEMRDDEFRRRAYRVSRGFDLTRPPEGVHYRRFHGNLTGAENKALLESAIRTYQPQLVVVDSFTALMLGRDTNSIDDVAARLSHLDELGATVLLIDHVAKGNDFSTVSGPIGSVGKFNIMRSGLYVQSTRDGAGIVRPDKSNFGPLHDPIPFAIEFEGSASVRLIAPLPNTDPRIAPLEAGLNTEDRIMRLLVEPEHRSGLAADEIAKRLDAKEGTVRNALTRLKEAEKVGKREGGWHSLTPASKDEVSE